MSYKVKKAAVLGSGVMGSGIACHLANVGIDVLMLDIQPNDCLLYTSPSPRDRTRSRMPSSA